MDVDREEIKKFEELAMTEMKNDFLFSYLDTLKHSQVAYEELKCI